MTDLDIKRARTQTIAKVALVAVVGFVVSPFIFAAVQGLVGLIIAGVVGVTAVNLAPVFGMKIANLRMKMLVAESERNPIETLRNLYVEKAKELDEADSNISDFEAEIGNFNDQVSTFKQTYPDEASRYEQIATTMEAGLREMKLEHQQAQHNLTSLAMALKKAEAIYKMALAAAKVTAFSRNSEAKVFQDIKQQVAFDSVRTQLNRSFAQLNSAVSKRQALLAEKGAAITP